VVQQVALADTVASGVFGAVFVSCTNPAATLPNQGPLRRGLSDGKVFLAVHETHWTETARMADVVLPALTYLEKDDLVLPWSHPYLRRSAAAVAPVTEGRTEASVMADLARRLGREERWLYADPWAELEAAFQGALRVGTFRGLLSGETAVLGTPPENRFETPSGRIELFSSSALDRGLAPLPLQAAPDPSSGPFVLLNSATRRYTHTQFREVYGPIPAEVTLHPSDACRLGVAEGEPVVLSNERGCLRMRAVVSADVPPGVLWAPRQCTDDEGRPMNLLTDSRPQVLGGGSRFNATRVDVTAAPSG
jgi:anaerobic selenocysteine-containing dehydrogenase